MFENKTFEDIHYSRFIASWIRAGGKKCNYRFEDWLKTLTINGKAIPDEIVKEIVDLGSNGKMELEHVAEKFLKG